MSNSWNPFLDACDEQDPSAPGPPDDNASESWPGSSRHPQGGHTNSLQPNLSPNIYSGSAANQDWGTGSGGAPLPSNVPDGPNFQADATQFMTQNYAPTSAINDASFAQMMMPALPIIPAALPQSDRALPGPFLALPSNQAAQAPIGLGASIDRSVASSGDSFHGHRYARTTGMGVAFTSPTHEGVDRAETAALPRLRQTDQRNSPERGVDTTDFLRLEVNRVNPAVRRRNAAILSFRADVALASSSGEPLDSLICQHQLRPTPSRDRPEYQVIRLPTSERRLYMDTRPTTVAGEATEITRDIWKPGDRDGDINRGHVCGAGTNKWKLFQDPLEAGKIPPKYVVLDDLAVYHVINGHIGTYSQRRNWWQCDFTKTTGNVGRLRKGRPNRGRPPAGGGRSFFYYGQECYLGGEPGGYTAIIWESPGDQ